VIQLASVVLLHTPKESHAIRRVEKKLTRRRKCRHIYEPINNVVLIEKHLDLKVDLGGAP
jgi:hypothetical protein